MSDLTFNEYCRSASKTAKFETEKFQMEEMMYVALGLNGEAGEVIEKIEEILLPTLGLNKSAGAVAERVKKIWRDDNKVLTLKKKEALVKELGDVTWYLSQCCSILGVSFSDVAQANLSKLGVRQEKHTLRGDGDNR
jgi:NTP pyrophosphatase (non-canonical NTP hydrolase)